MSQSKRSIAVVVAAYNAASTLDRAIASALAQPEVAELCVVDDQSSDTSFAIASAWAERDGRVLALRQHENAGPSAARNKAIEATSAPWLAVLDADDYLLDGRFAVLQAHAAEADFVADALVRTIEGANFAFVQTPFAPETLTLEGFLLGDLPRPGQLNLGFLKPMMRRAFLDRFGLRYDERMRLGEDFDLYAKALAHGAAFRLGAAAGYVSIERPGSLSLNHSAADLEGLSACYAGIRAVRPLSPSEATALRQHWRFVDRRLQWSRFVEAFKAGDFGTAASTFGSPHAAQFLIAQLAEQAWRRGTAFARNRFATR
jgi:succinoglycan biosynthesis protein ExoU